MSGIFASSGGWTRVYDLDLTNSANLPGGTVQLSGASATIGGVSWTTANPSASAMATVNGTGLVMTPVADGVERSVAVALTTLGLRIGTHVRIRSQVAISGVGSQIGGESYFQTQFRFDGLLTLANRNSEVCGISAQSGGTLTVVRAAYGSGVLAVNDSGLGATDREFMIESHLNAAASMSAPLTSGFAAPGAMHKLGVATNVPFDTLQYLNANMVFQLYCYRHASGPAMTATVTRIAVDTLNLG